MSKKSVIPEYLSAFAQDNNTEIVMTANHGYVVAPQKILRCYRLSDFEKLLLLELLSYMGENNYAFPSHKRLAFKLGKKSVSSIKKALNSLKDKGFITWTKGRGDIGSNRYYLSELTVNPYIILSEFVHYFVERILEKYRNEISYESIYGPILSLVEKQTFDLETQDVYGICLNHLFKNSESMNRIDMYDLLAEHLIHCISINANIAIKINTLELITDHFEEYHPHLQIDEEDHEIYKELKGPNDSKEFEIIGNHLPPEVLEIARREYPKIEAFLEKQEEYTLYKWFLYDSFLPNPSFTALVECSVEDFHLLSEQDLVGMIKKEFTIPMVKVFLMNVYLSDAVNNELEKVKG